MSSYRVLSLPASDPKVGPYLGLIISNWLTTLRYTNDWFKFIDEDTYFKVYGQVVRALLNKSSCQIRIAVLSDDEDVCLGFCLYEGKTVHYCFVQRDQRKQGIARSLLPAEFFKITHLTVPGVVIWKNKFPHAIFDPFLT
jgi:hypothetical protein